MPLWGLANNTLTADLAAGNFNGIGFKQVTFNSEIANGNSGASFTIDWTQGDKQTITLTANCTFTFTAPSGVSGLVLRLVQDATGSRTVTWPSMKWAGGAAPTLTTAANSVDIVSIYYNGTNYYGVASLNFA